MKIHCYAVMSNPPQLVPAAPTRRWMDEFPSHHAYRCLPMSIANAYGWEIQSPCSFTIAWNGGPAASDISFTCEDDFPYLDHLVVSNFTHGIVTFHTGYLFQTEPGWNLLVTGPFNAPRWLRTSYRCRRDQLVAISFHYELAAYAAWSLSI